MGDYNFITKYAQKKEDGSKESWDEATDRIWDMHAIKYAHILTNNPEFAEQFEASRQAEKDKVFLSAQRFRQFASTDLKNGIFKHNMKAYNCSSTYMDRPEVFGELMYVLLNGAGAGISVQKRHVERLPSVSDVLNEDAAHEQRKLRLHYIGDSIEGWAKAIQALVDSYFDDDDVRVVFNYGKIRAKGTLIAGQFLAPGPDGLRNSIEKIREILDNAVIEGERLLYPIEVYDMAMWIADAVLSGGVRRSAILAMFSSDDDSMMNAKTGDWWVDNGQRAMSNNSAVVLRHSATRGEFLDIIKTVETAGEPGFAITEHEDVMYNPCFEIGMLPYFLDLGNKYSGWSVCNLTEINGGLIKTLQDFLDASVHAAFAGTLQAGYTEFKYLTEWTTKIIERDALIGVSQTGVMNAPDILLNPEYLRTAANLVKDVNEYTADYIGINHAIRTTAIKPAGNSSILLGTASGVHGEHAPRYIRNIRANNDEVGLSVVKATNKFSVEPSLTSKTDSVIGFAIKVDENSIMKSDLYGIKQLEHVATMQQHWVRPGTRHDLQYGIEITHNVSNTIQVPPGQWDAVGDYIWDNKDQFTGVSLLSTAGDLDYSHAPFQAVKSPEELMTEYGDGVFFASGLIVDSFGVFDHLWSGTHAAQYKVNLRPKASDDLMLKISMNKKYDWVRRLNKYAKNYFSNDLEKAIYCLKDVYLRHRYNKLKNESKPIDWSTVDFSKDATQNAADIEAACAGGGCEVL